MGDADGVARALMLDGDTDGVLEGNSSCGQAVEECGCYLIVVVDFVNLPADGAVLGKKKRDKRSITCPRVVFGAGAELARGSGFSESREAPLPPQAREGPAAGTQGEHPLGWPREEDVSG